MLRKVLISTVLIVIVIFIFGAFLPLPSVLAQEDVHITVFVDKDTLVVLVPGTQLVSLEGLGFEIAIGDARKTLYLDQYLSFQTIRFDAVRAPACFRLARYGTSSPLPLDCDPSRTLTQVLANADVFWYDGVANQTRTLQLVSGATPMDFCAAGQVQCEMVYTPPFFTPTPNPTQTAVFTSTSPTLTPTLMPESATFGNSDLVTAVVDLSPGANLHCRALPRSDARSLTLIPAGTALNVIGRMGSPITPNANGATPEPLPVIKTIEDLWLLVRWESADSGYSTCWVMAQYLRVEQNDRLLDTFEELWALPEEPFNQLGEIVNVNNVPSAMPLDAVIATVDLEPGVSLQLRRYPQSAAEALALVPAGVQLEVLGYVEAPSHGLVGEPTNPYWLYVRYTGNSDATIGWVSAQYVSTTKQGQPIEIEDLVEIDVNQAGYQESSYSNSEALTGTQEIIGIVNLNPGANLNMREKPTANSVVVIGIPNGETVLLIGRTEDGAWVKGIFTTSNGDFEGWLMVQYLTIDPPYDISNLPVSGE